MHAAVVADSLSMSISKKISKLLKKKEGRPYDFPSVGQV